MTEQETKRGVKEIRDGKIMQKKWRSLKKPRICMIAGEKCLKMEIITTLPTEVYKGATVGGKGVENVGKWGGTLHK